MLLIQILLYSFIGVAAGLLSGLLGIGGGIVIVPSLFFLINYFHFEYDYPMQLTASTALASMVLTTLTSTWCHQKKQGIDWLLVKRMFLGLLIGGILGVSIAERIPNDFLKVFFGLFLIFCALRYLLQKNTLKKEDLTEFQLPSRGLSSVVATSISLISSLLGIGGGIFSVCFFSSIKLDFRRSVGTASAVSFLITLIASACFLFIRKEVTGPHLENPLFCGPVYLPAFFSISLCSVLSVPIGVRLVYKLNAKMITRVFGGFLMILGIYMVAY